MASLIDTTPHRFAALLVAIATAWVHAPSAAEATYGSQIERLLTSYAGDSTIQFIQLRPLAGVDDPDGIAHGILAVFDTTGTYVSDLLEVSSDLPPSPFDGPWLVGTAAFEAAFGVTSDFLMPSGVLPSGGGMICFGGGTGAVPQNPPTWDRTDFANYTGCRAYGPYAGPIFAPSIFPTIFTPEGHSIVWADFDTAVCGHPISASGRVDSASAPATSPCDYRVAGTKLILKRASSGREKLTFLSQTQDGARIASIGSSDDPRLGGATVEVFSGTLASASIPIPAGEGTPGWAFSLFNPTIAGFGYTFVNGEAPSGISAVKKVVLKSYDYSEDVEVIKVVAKTTGVPMTSSHGSIGVRITTGMIRDCAFFSGTSVRVDVPGQFVAKGVPVLAADCSDGALTVGP